MTERLQVDLTGNLPGNGKYAILASVEDAVKACAAGLMEKHEGLTLTVSVRSVRPGNKTGAIVQAATLAPEPLVVPVPDEPNLPAAQDARELPAFLRSRGKAAE